MSQYPPPPPGYSHPVQWQQPPVMVQPVVVATGAPAWWCSLAVLAFIPAVNGVLASLLMFFVGRSMRDRSPLARVNGARAMNWALTYLITTVVVWGISFTGMAYQPLVDALGDGNRSPMMWMMMFWIAHTLVFLVGGVVGAVAAGKQRVVPINGLPFVR